MVVGRPPEENRGRLPDTKGNGLDGTTAVQPASSTTASIADAAVTFDARRPLPGEQGYSAWLALSNPDPAPWWPPEAWTPQGPAAPIPQPPVDQWLAEVDAICRRLLGGELDRVNRELDARYQPAAAPARRHLKAVPASPQPRPQRADIRSDQGQRPSFTQGSDNPRAKLGQPSSVDCGRTMLLRSRTDPHEGAAVRMFCKRKACPDCGPRKRAELTRHYVAMATLRPLVARTIARSSWATVAKRLQRAGASYVRIPQPQGRYLVLATAGPGEPVSDPQAAIGAAFEAMPADTAHVTSSRDWALTSTRPAAAAVDRPGRWEVLSAASVSYREVIRQALDRGWDRGPLQETLGADWADARRLWLPTPDTLEWEAFRQAIGLHWPGRARADSRLAA